MAIIDSHGRIINYLRLAVTDRCNLRCTYCMPHDGIDWMGRNDLLSYEELLRLTSILAKQGINKVRITGGEPFVRKDIISFLERLTQLEGVEQVSITTNGVLTAPFVPELKKMGIKSINLSLDTLDKQRFFEITRRDELEQVMQTMNVLMQYDMDIKLNAVVMDGKNTDDIVRMVALTKNTNLSVRFIEEMPFNGNNSAYHVPEWNHVRILDEIKKHYPDIYKLTDAPGSTSYNYQIPNHIGTVGIIAAYTRSFCGTCNRIRITPDGMLRTCLYDEGHLNLRDLLRNGANDSEILNAIVTAVNGKYIDGWETERNRQNHKIANESMATIGG